MGEALALAGVGFLLGMRHATDADHVIAITTIVARSKRFSHSTLIGALWGLGHTITVVTVGVAIIVFNVVIPPPVGLAMEFAVALMLILLGVLNLTGVMRRITERLTPPAPMHGHSHAHFHAHDEVAMHPHAHEHLHGHGRDRRLGHATDAQGGLIAQLGWYQVLRPVAIGLVHGLAGSAAVALLVLASIHDPGAAIAYLGVFCIGVVMGMAVITTLLGLPLMVTRARSVDLNRWLTIGSGVVSLAFGVYLGWHIGFVDGLFTGAFHWQPA